MQTLRTPAQSKPNFPQTNVRIVHLKGAQTAGRGGEVSVLTRQGVQPHETVMVGCQPEQIILDSDGTKDLVTKPTVREAVGPMLSLRTVVV